MVSSFRRAMSRRDGAKCLTRNLCRRIRGPRGRSCDQTCRCIHLIVDIFTGLDVHTLDCWSGGRSKSHEFEVAPFQFGFFPTQEEALGEVDLSRRFVGLAKNINTFDPNALTGSSACGRLARNDEDAPNRFSCPDIVRTCTHRMWLRSE